MVLAASLAVLQLTFGQTAQPPGTPSQAQPQTPALATATIRGHVTGGDTGAPVRKVQVRLTQIGGFQQGAAPTGRENRLATTDADGLYEFKDLPAARYNITATKTGYVSVQWGQRTPRSSTSNISVALGGMTPPAPRAP